MAAINFPDAPVDGNTYYYATAGITFTYKDTGAGTGYWHVTTPGSVSVATPAEIDTGTDNAKYITPLGLAGSNYNQALEIFNIIRPVGSYFQSDLNVPPSIGTWTPVLGVSLFAQDGTAGYVAGNTGGSKNAVNISHNHGTVATTSDSHWHYHGVRTGANVPRLYGETNTTTAIGNQSVSNSYVVPKTSTDSHSHNVTVSTTGVAGTNLNMHPYKAVYTWVRTA